MVFKPPQGVSDQPFDAQFLDGPVWRLEDPRAAVEAVATARPIGIQLIHGRFDGSVDLSGLGFRRIETLVTYEGPLDPTAEMPAHVRPGAANDADACREIAAAAFTHDRWHADPKIPDRAAVAIKGAWVENDVRGRADRVLIATDPEEPRRVQGFLLVLERRGVAVIDLIAVAPRAQGHGGGKRLMQALSAECGGRCALGRAGTQETNLTAIRFYERSGWRLADRR
jgi:GNAT superfamily N-acetyltransferase